MRRLRHVNRHTCTGAQTDCECSESQSSPPGLQVPQGLQWGFLGWLPPAADDLLPSPELGSLAALSVPTSPLSSGDIPRRPGRSGVHGRRGAVAKAAVMKTQEAGASCPSSPVPCPKGGSRLCPSQAEDAASAEVPRQDRPGGGCSGASARNMGAACEGAGGVGPGPRPRRRARGRASVLGKRGLARASGRRTRRPRLLCRENLPRPRWPF